MSSELAQIYDIGELVDVTQVLAINSKTKHLLRDEGLPLLRITDLFSGSYSQFVTQEGVPKQCIANSEELIYTRTGQVGFVFTNKVGVVHNNCFKVTPKDDRLSRRYLYWYLRQESVRSYVNTVASGSVQKDLNHSAFKTLKIPLLDLEAQRQIDSILSSLDDRITLLRETNATLEAIAQALFKSWFVDFDPVRAKMEGRTPEGMDEATAALFPDGFETSELGDVPRGWVFKPFGALLAHSIGGDWGSEQPEEKNTVRVAIIRGTDIPDLQNGRDNRVPIRYTSEKKLSTRQLQDGDIVIEVSGGSKDQPTGRALYVTDDLLKRFDCPVEPASFCRLFRPVDQATGVLLGQHLRFIYDQGKTWEYQNQSTGIANFQTMHFLEKELVAVPPDSVLNVFSGTVRALVDRTVISQIDELSHIRDTLLPRLISGQLQLPEVADAH